MERFEGFERWLPRADSPAYAVADRVDRTASRQWLEALYESPVLFSGLLDTDGRVLEANRLSVEGCGLVRAEVIGTPFWECGWWSPDAAMAGRIRRWCEQAAATGASLSVVCRYFKGDGSSGMVDLGLVPIVDFAAPGEPVRWVVATGLDVSHMLTEQASREDRLKTETAMSRETERRFRGALDAMIDNVTIAHAVRDEDGTIVDFQIDFANRSSLDGAGRAAAELVGHRVCDIYPGLRRSGLFDTFVRVVDSGETYVAQRVAYTHLVDEGPPISGFWDLHVSKLDDGYIVASRDVTAAVRDEQIVRDAHAAAARERAAIDILQQAALNVDLPAIEGLSIGLNYRPATRDVPIGGDWYDVLALDDRLVLAIADVAGHGPDSAGLMVQVRNVLRTVATQYADPADLLREANRVIVCLQRDQLPFITCCVATLSPTTHELRWSLAGHPPALLRAGDGSCRYLSSAPGLPLGVGATADYTTGTVTLAPGDRVVLYTDGLIEGRRDSLDDGMRRLVHGVHRCTDLPAPMAAEWLAAHVSSGDDDVALIVADVLADR